MSVHNEHGHQLKRLLLLAGLLVPFTGSGQHTQIMQDFCRQEQESWKEYYEAVRSWQADSTIDVRFYHLTLDLTIATPYLQGNVLCRFNAATNNITSFKLNLRREFTIDSIAGDASGFSTANDTILVGLNRTFAAGESGWVQVYYKGVPPVANNTKGLRYVNHASSQRVIASLSTPFLAHYWWPCKDGPGDKPDSIYVDITIPDTSITGFPVIAISNGLLSHVAATGGRKTFFWRHRYPIVPYYVMAAVSNYRDIHQTFTGTHNEQFPMDYYVFNEHLTAAQQGVADMPLVMAAFSDRFGIYPFSGEKYGMTQLGFYGAIENQTNTIINNMGLSYFGVSVHELAHMWFGDMITCKDWHHGWLNEGFASYAEALWTEHTGGFTAYRNYMTNFQFFTGGTLYLQNISDPFNIFIPIIYDKGAFVLHMLRGVLGDSLFFASISAYAGNPSFRYGHATTEDFKSVCETISQRNLAYFFNQWVYDQYYPAYGYNFTQNLSTGETIIYIRQMQASQGRRAVFEMPVRIKFLFQGGGDTTVTLWNDQQVQTFPLLVSRAISSMQFDPDMWLLRTAQVVSVDGKPSQSVPFGFRLGQNYPNPFNPVTTIGFRIADYGLVSLKVYDLLGREVATLVDEVKEAGEHSILFDASGIPSGVYVYRLTTRGFFAANKMLLIR